MRKELDEKLCEKYPKIFVNRHADMRTTAMCWGFECGDGWYNIIDMLCANIQSHIDWNRKQRSNDLRRLRAARKGREALLKFLSPDREPPNWCHTRADEILQELANGTFKVSEKVSQVVASQVKEKFGTLRFYYDGGDNTIYGMARMAESMSAVTCEECGAPGRQRGGSWIHTACDEHARDGDK